MTRILDRVASLARFLFTSRGLMILGATGLSFLALFVDQGRLLLGTLAIGIWALVLLLASLRQAELNSTVGQLKKDVANSRRTSGTFIYKQGRPAPYGPVGAGNLAVEHAKAALAATREALAIPSSAALQSQSGATSDGGWVPGACPLVSVIVPCYNDARYISESLGSVIAQTFEDWECIVIDDGSIDESAELISQIAETDDRIRYVRHGVNAGLSAARNTGLRLSRGRLLAFLDSDDLLAEDSLLDRVETLGRYWDQEDVAGSFCGVKVGSDVTSLAGLGPSEEWTSPLPFIDFITGADDCPFPVLAPLVRRRVVVGVGGFDESMRSGAEDWDLWQRVLRAGFIFVPSSLKSAVYRQRMHSMAKSDAAQHVREGAEMVARAYEALSGRPAFSTPYPFTSGIDSYRKNLAVGRRAVRSAAMTLVSGNRTEAGECLDVLVAGSWAWLDRHLDIEATATDGVRRGLGLEKGQVEALKSEIAPFVAEIVGEVLNRTSASVEEPSEVGQPPNLDILFVPQNGAQLEAMLSAAEPSLSDSQRIGVLQVDRLAGDQGVARGLALVNVPTWSVNEWWLTNGLTRQLVVPAVRDTSIESLIASAKESGVPVAEVEEPGAHLMRVLPTQRDDLAVYQPGGSAKSSDGARILTASSPFGSRALDNALAPESVWRLEENHELKTDGASIERFRGIHKGERVVIVGNGPSLNKIDLARLEGTVTIGVNAIFLATDDTGFRPTYYVVEDTAVVRDNLDRILSYRTDHRFFPSIYREAIGESAETSFFNMNRGFYEGRSPSFCVPRFSTDAALRLFSGQSVTAINLQLAYFMGFAEVVLIGMDFSYTVPEDSVVEGNRILSQGDDPNHFHPDYFGKGKVWKDPKLDRVLANYQLAKLMYEADGRRIVNATPGGKLELFERVPFDELFPK